MSRSRNPTAAGPLASRERLGSIDLLLLLMAAMWGTNFSVLKVGLADVPPLFFATARLVLAVGMMLVLAAVARQSLRVERRDLLSLVGVGLLGHSVYMLLFVHGAARTSADNAALILATVPVWVALFGILGGAERVSRVGWFGVLLSFGGIVLIVSGSDAGATLEFGGASLVGDLLVLLATLAWSGYSVLVRPLVRRSSATAVTVIPTAAGTLPLVLLTLPTLRVARLHDISGRGWTALVVSALIGIALPYFIWNLGIRRLGSARTSLYSYLVPVTALLVAWGWLGETLTALQMVGGALVLGGVVLARWSHRAPEPPVAADSAASVSAGP